MKKKTNIDMSLGDAIDKVTILIRKIYFGEDQAYKEFVYLTEGIDKLNLKLSGAILACIIRLAFMNFEIWNRENGMRRGEDFPPEIVKKLANEIRNCNERRITHKNEINRLTEMGFRELKRLHRSKW